MHNNSILNSCANGITGRRYIKMNIIVFLIILLWLAFNCIVSKAMTTKETQTKFVDGQNVVGKIATNIFYAPAWFLKLLKITIIKTVK